MAASIQAKSSQTSDAAATARSREIFLHADPYRFTLETVRVVYRSLKVG